MVQNNPQITFNQEQSLFNCTGIWSVMDVGSLLKKFTSAKLPKTQKIKISGEGISHLDSAGALALIKCIEVLKQRDNQVELTDFSGNHQKIIGFN